MYKNCVGYYLDTYETLLPSDTSLGDVADHLWFLYIKGKFNDMVWADFYDREVFNNHKFPSSDPESAYENIIKTIKIRMINKDRIYDRMFNAFMADYNPLWNVDGITGRITESTHTGTDTDTKEGTDTLSFTGGHSNVRSGNEELEYAGTESTEYKGKESTDYKGTEDLEYLGTETNTRNGDVDHTTQVTTFDSSTLRQTQKMTDSYTNLEDEKEFTNRKDTKSFTNRTDEKSFTNRQDDRSFTDRTDTTTYNDITDTFAYDPVDGEKQETEYDSTFTKTLNLSDKDLELIIRQGNIGVTKSSELLHDTLALYDNYLMDFVRYVVNDCINQISYAIW